MTMACSLPEFRFQIGFFLLYIFLKLIIFILFIVFKTPKQLSNKQLVSLHF